MNAVIMRAETLNLMAVWARTTCVMLLGPVEGEKHWRTLPATGVLRLWVMFQRTE